MTDESDDVPGMAEAVEARRKRRKLSPGGFASAAGLTPTGLAPVRKGTRKDYSEKTTVGVARALRWPLDWYDRLLAGEDPASFPDVDHGDVETTGAGEEADDLKATVERLTAVVERLDQAVRDHWPRAAP